MGSNVTNDNKPDEDVDECCTAETKVDMVSVVSLWNLACNKLNAMYGGDASKVRKVYEYVIASKGEFGSTSESNCIAKTQCECEHNSDPKESEENVDNTVKVIGTINTDNRSENKNDTNDSHSDMKTEQSTSKSCTSFESDMSSEIESESSSDAINDDTKSPVFIPNKESWSMKSLIQSKEKLKEMDISDDSVKIIDVSVKVKVEPDDMETLKPIKKPLVIDITNGDNTEETNYN